MCACAFAFLGEKTVHGVSVSYGCNQLTVPTNQQATRHWSAGLECCKQLLSASSICTASSSGGSLPGLGSRHQRHSCSRPLQVLDDSTRPCLA